MVLVELGSVFCGSILFLQEEVYSGGEYWGRLVFIFGVLEVFERVFLVTTRACCLDLLFWTIFFMDGNALGSLKSGLKEHKNLF